MDPEHVPMWMLGMQFNIDIIWFDENANVVAIEKNVPLCEDDYRSCCM